MQTDFSNSLMFGMYRCEVVSVNDPEKLMRAKIRIIGEWDGVNDVNLPWAEYMLPVGSRNNDGDFKPVVKGDLVWCNFDRGDSRYPIIVGSCFLAPNGTPNLPHESFAGGESYQHKRTAAQPIPDASGYHRDWVSTQNSVMVERALSGAYRVTHKPTGTAVEITKDGQFVLHVENDSFESTSHNKLLEAELKISVIGKKQILIHSKEANVKVTAATECTVDAPKIKLNGGAPIVTTAHICAYTGKTHSDGSSTCTAGK